MQKILRDYSLSLVLFVLFASSWLGQFIFQLAEVANHALEHGQSFQWSEFWPEFGTSTFENWQSEFLQLFTFVTLTSFLIHRGSPESKDTDEEMQATLSRIEKRINGLEKKPARR
jgi:hypothetical protein